MPCLIWRCNFYPVVVGWCLFAFASSSHDPNIHSWPFLLKSWEVCRQEFDNITWASLSLGSASGSVKGRHHQESAWCLTLPYSALQYNHTATSRTCIVLSDSECAVCFLLWCRLIYIIVQLPNHALLCDPVDCNMPGVCSNAHPRSQWCYLTIWSSATLFFCL